MENKQKSKPQIAFVCKLGLKDSSLVTVLLVYEVLSGGIKISERG